MKTIQYGATHWNARVVYGDTSMLDINGLAAIDHRIINQQNETMETHHRAHRGFAQTCFIGRVGQTEPSREVPTIAMVDDDAGEDEDFVVEDEDDIDLDEDDEDEEGDDAEDDEFFDDEDEDDVEDDVLDDDEDDADDMGDDLFEDEEEDII